MKSPDGRECSTLLNFKKIALTGKRTSTLYLINPHEEKVEKVEVDGCAITEGIRCDWLVVRIESPNKEEIFVELKGSHVSDAILQLRESIIRLSVQKKTHPKRAVIVFTRNPMAGTDVQNHQVRFIRDFHAKLILVKDRQELPL